MEDYRRQLEQVRKQIEPLEAQLLPLKREERRLIGLLRTPPTENTPIDRLSDDILREIFVRALPSAHERALSSRSLSLRETVAPVLLCFVCKRWRRVAREFAPLWTTLRLFVQHEQPDNPSNDHLWQSTGGQHARQIEGWNALTKGAPIQLHIVIEKNARDSFGFKSTATLLNPPMLSHLAAPADLGRLTKLTLCRVRHLDALELPSGAFGALQDLVLSLGDWPEERERREGPRVVRAFEKCPALRRVALDRVNVSKGASGECVPSIVLPWTQLTHLIAFADTPTTFFDQHMNDCPALSVLLFAVDTWEDEVLDPSKSYTRWKWPSLTSLSIYHPSSEGGSWLPLHLGHIDPKHLQTLRIITELGEYCDYTSDAIAVFASWLRSIDALKTLAIPLHSGSDDLSGLLHLTPEVETLELRMPYEDLGGDLMGLAKKGREGVFPRLSKLVLQCVGDENTKDGLLRFVEQRMQTGGQEDGAMVVAGTTSVSTASAAATNNDDSASPVQLERLVILYESDDARDLPEEGRQLLGPGIWDDFSELQRFQERGLVVECVEVRRAKERARRMERMQLGADWLWVERDEVLGEGWPEVWDFLWVCERDYGTGY